jgi:hypothetical protein
MSLHEVAIRSLFDRSYIAIDLPDPSESGKTWSECFTKGSHLFLPDLLILATFPDLERFQFLRASFRRQVREPLWKYSRPRGIECSDQDVARGWIHQWQAPHRTRELSFPRFFFLLASTRLGRVSLFSRRYFGHITSKQL